MRERVFIFAFEDHSMSNPSISASIRFQREFVEKNKLLRLYALNHFEKLKINFDCASKQDLIDITTSYYKLYFVQGLLDQKYNYYYSNLPADYDVILKTNDFYTYMYVILQIKIFKSDLLQPGKRNLLITEIERLMIEYEEINFKYEMGLL
jgi:hypothetical protein